MCGAVFRKGGGVKGQVGVQGGKTSSLMKMQ